MSKQKLGLTPLTDRDLLMRLLLDTGHVITPNERQQAADLLAAIETGQLERLNKSMRDRFFNIGRAKGLFEKGVEAVKTSNGRVVLARKDQPLQLGSSPLPAWMGDSRLLPKSPPRRKVG